MLRRNVGRVRYEPADRTWFTALTRFIPRRRWTGVFPVTPARGDAAEVPVFKPVAVSFELTTCGTQSCN